MRRSSPWPSCGYGLLVAARRNDGPTPSTATWVWWAVLAWLALDEGSAIHEKLERWLETDWQLLYVPVMGIAALAWWGVIRRYRNQPRIAVLVAGAALWAAVLTLELVQNWGGAPVQAAISPDHDHRGSTRDDRIGRLADRGNAGIADGR